MADAQTLNYKVVGGGHPIVLLHGFLLDQSIWEAIAHRLSKHFKLIFIDLPGHGGSKSYLLQDEITIWREAIGKIIDREIQQEYSIVGHSLGGYVALDLLRATPKNIHHCILLNSNFWADTAEQKKDRDRIISVLEKSPYHFIIEAIPNLFPHSERLKHKKTIEVLIKNALKMPQEGIINTVKMMRDRPSYEAVMVEHQDKVSIVQGEKDNIVPKEQILYYTKTLDLTEKCIVFLKTGHMSSLEAPGEVSKIVYKVLPKIRR